MTGENSGILLLRWLTRLHLGTKRASPETEATTESRPSKVAKTSASEGQSKGSTKKAPKNIADPETEAVSVDSFDIGFIGNLTLVPSTFSTGSFGWKGSKRITVELQDSEGEEKEKVQVMLSINATVIGSKPKAGPDAADVLEEEEDEESKPEDD
ncbi:hypothetical protein C0991_000433 [Blastosporella zonata]|nr:hypothetical protein C0991_000433 [Blastosporella zonata]